MIKNFFSKFTVPRSPYVASSQFYAFSSASPTNKQILTKHQRQLKMYQYQKTRMTVPDDVVKIDSETFINRGFKTFLRPFGLFAEQIGIYEAKNVPELEGKNTPTGSWLKIKFPFKDDAYIRSQFIKPRGHGVRIGRLLELLDYLAGAVSYKYAKLGIGGDAFMATACVDHFEIFDPVIDENKDLYMTGYICHVGRSSMEVRVDVSNSEEGDDLVASAFYLFVARNAKDPTKSHVVPELSFEGEKDPEGAVIRYETGKKNQLQRRTTSERSVFKIPPSHQEGAELHSLFKQTLDDENRKLLKPIPETRVEKTMLMHLQDINIHGKIFGGFVMREAAELAWATSFLHSQGKSLPEFLHIDDFVFLNPVEIGSIATFEAYVTYTEDNYSSVVVSVDTTKGDTKEKIRTCELHITFAHDADLRKVYPQSYFDGMMYLEGKRRFLAI